jgi:hypothetical protein
MKLLIDAVILDLLTGGQGYTIDGLKFYLADGVSITSVKNELLPTIVTLQKIKELAQKVINNEIYTAQYQTVTPISYPVRDYTITNDVGGCANVKSAIATLYDIMIAFLRPAGQNYQDASKLALYNKEYIVSETHKFITNTYTTLNLSASEITNAKAALDDYVDALVYDLLTNGNSAIVNYVSAYLNSSGTAVTSFIYKNVTATNAAYNKARDYTISAINETLVSPSPLTTFYAYTDPNISVSAGPTTKVTAETLILTSTLSSPQYLALNVTKTYGVSLPSPNYGTRILPNPVIGGITLGNYVYGQSSGSIAEVTSIIERTAKVKKIYTRIPVEFDVENSPVEAEFTNEEITNTTQSGTAEIYGYEVVNNTLFLDVIITSGAFDVDDIIEGNVSGSIATVLVGSTNRLKLIDISSQIEDGEYFTGLTSGADATLDQSLYNSAPIISNTGGKLTLDTENIEGYFYGSQTVNSSDNEVIITIVEEGQTVSLTAGDTVISGKINKMTVDVDQSLADFDIGDSISLIDEISETKTGDESTIVGINETEYAEAYFENGISGTFAENDFVKLLDSQSQEVANAYVTSWNPTTNVLNLDNLVEITAGRLFAVRSIVVGNSPTINYGTVTKLSRRVEFYHTDTQNTVLPINSPNTEIGIDGTHIDASNLLISNKDFIAKEVSGYIKSQYPDFEFPGTPASQSDYSPSSSVSRFKDASNLIYANSDYIIEETTGYIKATYPDFMYPGTPTSQDYWLPSSSVNRFKDAGTLIKKNRQYIIDTTINNLIAAYPTFVFPNNDQTKCRRDLGYVIDAIANDLYDGGNANIYDATIAYFDQATGGLLSNGLVGELTQSIYAFNQVRDLCKLAITNNLPTTDLTITADPSTGSNTNTNSCSNVQSAITSLTAILTGILTDGSLINLPKRNVGTWTTGENKCKRDLEYFIKGVANDLYDGGNQNTRTNTLYYFSNATTLLTNGLAGEVTQSVAAFNYARDLMKAAITNTLPTGTYTGLTPVQDLTISADPTTGSNQNSSSCTQVQSAITTLTAIMTTALNAGNTSSVPTETVGTWSTNEVKCERDIKYWIDAIAHNVRYGGNSKVVNSALYYYDAVTGTFITNGIAGEESQSIAGLTYLKTLLPYVINNIPVPTSYQNARHELANYYAAVDQVFNDEVLYDDAYPTAYNINSCATVRSTINTLVDLYISILTDYANVPSTITYTTFDKGALIANKNTTTQNVIGKATIVSLEEVYNNQYSYATINKVVLVGSTKQLFLTSVVGNFNDYCRITSSGGYVSYNRKTTQVLGKVDRYFRGFDGVQTTFDLTYNNGIQYFPNTEGYVLIFVNGILQQPGISYITFSDKITFYEAPQFGSSFVGTYLGKMRILDDISFEFDSLRSSFNLKRNNSFYSLTVTEGSSALTKPDNNIIVSMNGVIQKAGEGYDLSGSRINFTEVPRTGSQFIGFAYIGSDADVVQDIVVPEVETDDILSIEGETEDRTVAVIESSNSLVTYNYDGPVYGKSAVLTAVISKGLISETQISAGGSGYTSRPEVVVTSTGGFDGQLKALVGVSSVNLVDGGYGYRDPEVIAATVELPNSTLLLGTGNVFGDFGLDEE